MLFEGRATHDVKSFDKTNPDAHEEQTPFELYKLQFGIVALTATQEPPFRAKLFEQRMQA